MPWFSYYHALILCADLKSASVYIHNFTIRVTHTYYACDLVNLHNKFLNSFLYNCQKTADPERECLNTVDKHILSHERVIVFANNE